MLHCGVDVIPIITISIVASSILAVHVKMDKILVDGVMEHQV